MKPLFRERIGRLRDEMSRGGIDVVAISPGTNLQYLAGTKLHYDERPCALFVSTDKLRFLVPSLNADQASAQAGEIELVTWTDEAGPRAAIEKAAADLGRSRSLAVDPVMRADTLVPITDVFRSERMLLATSVIEPLRLRKSPEELALLQASAAQADRVLAIGADACRDGATEAEVAHVVEEAFRRDGAEAIDFVIIGSGPNSAFPHHQTGRRAMAAGEAVMIDIGATLDGYKSDITRMVHLGAPSTDFMGVYDAVRIANDRARTAVRPGVRARDIDRAARSALADLGLAEYFVHRTGHGLGMDVHEPPYITATSDVVLEPGMVFSVEPGVYLPGKFGVRIEDIVVVTEDGSRTLTGAPHDVFVR